MLVCGAQVQDLRSAEREYQAAIEQLETELHSSQVIVNCMGKGPILPSSAAPW